MVKIFLIEDQASYRDSIAQLINNHENFNCEGIFECFESAQKRILQDKPDIVLVDIKLPGISGIEATKIINSLSPETAIIILTIFDDCNLIFSALENGASGYILKDDNPENIICAINEVLNGGAPMSMSIARKVIESFKKPNAKTELTKQQITILKLLSKGKNYQAIADDLFISKTTVKYHLRNIYQKLHVKNKVNAISKAKDEGII
ncbi:MAG: response regulator transcription factor [Ignavibacteriae bacterium]|nr:response regulator transcription factor [Ignavibacteriota bacterium]